MVRTLYFAETTPLRRPCSCSVSSPVLVHRITHAFAPSPFDLLEHVNSKAMYHVHSERGRSHGSMYVTHEKQGMRQVFPFVSSKEVVPFRLAPWTTLCDAALARRCTAAPLEASDMPSCTTNSSQESHPFSFTRIQVRNLGSRIQSNQREILSTP
jgi:hypothetical protein